jgi:small subunit ribosomal protein S12
MPTIYQLLKTIRVNKNKKSKKPALEKCPQKKGVILKAFKVTPRKPNSAIRKVVRLSLSNNRQVTAYIPGMWKHHLQRHSVILMRGGRVRDLPGIKYKAIRGKFDLKPVPRRRSARSKYGIKRF